LRTNRSKLKNMNTVGAGYFDELVEREENELKDLQTPNYRVLDQNIAQAERLLGVSKEVGLAKEDSLLAFSSYLDTLYNNAASQKKGMKEAVKRASTMEKWL